MHHGCLILKPDFFENKAYYNEFLNVLLRNNCFIEECFIIKNYTQINNEYRKVDLKKRFKNKEKFAKNFTRVQIAFNSYNLSEYRNVGVLTIINTTKKVGLKDFYNLLNTIKASLRDYIQRCRNYVYLYLDNEGNHPQLVKAEECEFDIIKEKYNNTKLAFINGIHLEDYNLFKRNICYKTFKKLNIITDLNCFDPKDINLLFDKFKPSIDLHIHSNFSDGILSYKEIYKMCNLNKIEYASICDHDNIKSYEINNPSFIPGIECNVMVNNKKQHVLCYNMDTNNKYFKKIIYMQTQNRVKQLYYRLSQLENLYGFTFSEIDIQNLIVNNHYSREHIAELIVLYGYNTSKEDAIYKYINKLRHGKFLLSLRKLSKLIHLAGGYIILAHPLGNYKNRITFEDFQKNCRTTLRYVDGIETFYSCYNNDEINKLFIFAQQNKLITTCGSDYHGTRNSNEKIGKIYAEDLSFENICNYLITKKFINDKLFRRKND